MNINLHKHVAFRKEMLAAQNNKTASIDEKKILSEVDKGLYVLRDELWDMGADLAPEPTEMQGMAYNKEGEWIGDEKDAKFLCDEKGIYPEKAKESHCVCSIGYSMIDQKYYGWSHRGICGFALGDMIYEEDAEGCNEDTPFIEHGTKTILSVDDQKQAAINFADSMS